MKWEGLKDILMAKRKVWRVKEGLAGMCKYGGI
jgi:hypothetical protein